MYNVHCTIIVRKQPCVSIKYLPNIYRGIIWQLDNDQKRYSGARLSGRIELYGQATC